MNLPFDANHFTNFNLNHQDFNDAIQKAVFFELACRILLTGPNARPLDADAVKQLCADGAKASKKPGSGRAFSDHRIICSSQYFCDSGAEWVHVGLGHARDIDAAGADDIDAVFFLERFDLVGIESAERKHAALTGQE